MRRGAGRGGCASSPRRCEARARRTDRAGRAVRRPSRGSFHQLSSPSRRICSALVSTLTYRFEEIAPRPLRPEVFELDGISRASVEAHYKLYEGYVGKRNEILRKLADVDLAAANQVYSELRALKVDLTFAIGGIKNHELYFGHLGGGGGDPDGAFGDLVARHFGSA